MTKDAKTLDGACHCGAVRFTVRLADGSRAPGGATATIAECVVLLWQLRSSETSRLSRARAC